jgi:hypothetical protein
LREKEIISEMLIITERSEWMNAKKEGGKIAND